MILFFFSGGSQYSFKNPHNNLLLVARGYSVDLDCQLNDPYAKINVSLLQERTQRIPDGVKVTQSGQIFTINNVENTDKGRYHCKVQSTVKRIEQLIAVQDRSGSQLCTCLL